MPATGLSIVRDDMTTTTRRATSMPPVADQRDPPNESTSTTGQSFLSRLAVVLQGSGRGSLSAPDRSPNSPLPMTSLASSDPDAASGEPRNSSGGSISVTGQSLCPQVSINLHGADPESQSTPNRSSSASQLVTSPASSGPTATGDQSPTSTSAAASMTLLEQDHPIGLSSSPNLSNQPSYSPAVGLAAVTLPARLPTTISVEDQRAGSTGSRDKVMRPTLSDPLSPNNDLGCGGADEASAATSVALVDREAMARCTTETPDEATTDSAGTPVVATSTSGGSTPVLTKTSTPVGREVKHQAAAQDTKIGVDNGTADDPLSGAGGVCPAVVTPVPPPLQATPGTAQRASSDAGTSAIGEVDLGPLAKATGTATGPEPGLSTAASLSAQALPKALVDGTADDALLPASHEGLRVPQPTGHLSLADNAASAGRSWDPASAGSAFIAETASNTVASSSLATATSASLHPSPLLDRAEMPPSTPVQDRNASSTLRQDTRSSSSKGPQATAASSSPAIQGAATESSISPFVDLVISNPLSLSADAQKGRPHVHDVDEETPIKQSNVSASAVLVGLQDTMNTTTAAEQGVPLTASTSAGIGRNDLPTPPTDQPPRVVAEATIPGVEPPDDRPATTATPAEAVAALMTQASSTDGGGKLTVSLHPKELGAVTVDVERGADGSTKITVSASEPGTLRSLMTNRDQLHAALDAASVPVVGRHLAFELSEPSVTATAQHTHAATMDHRNHIVAQEQSDSQANSSAAGFRNSEQQRDSATRDHRHPSQQAPQDASDSEDGSALIKLLGSATSSARHVPSAGINITA